MTQASPRQLEYLIATIEAGTVTGAAQTCHVSQSAVSVGLRELERLMGAELFVDDRSRGMVPTVAGRALAARATEILALIDALPITAREHSPGLAGVLRVGCFESLSTIVLPDLVAETVERNPALRIEFAEDSANELVRRLRFGEFDAIICPMNQIPADLESETFVTTRRHVLLTASHRLAQRKSVWLSELADETAIFLDLPPTIEWLNALVRSVGVVPRLQWSSRSMATIRALVARGLGYTIVNVRHPASVDDGAPLVHLRLEDDLGVTGIAAAWRSGPPSANVRALLAHLHAESDKWLFGDE